jgi:hypothetical protein
MSRRKGWRGRVTMAGRLGTSLALLAGIGLLFSACGATTGPVQQVKINEPLGAAATTDVLIKMGAGSLTLRPGAEGLASGTIDYNVPSAKPAVKRGESDLSIEQSGPNAPVLGKIINNWDLQLGKAPMTLTVEAGAYNGSLDLTGLTLQSLTIKDGAAKNEVTFNSPNPGQMETFSYKTGASTVTLKNLANANFRKLTFEGGAGSYLLDFGGTLRAEANAQIKAGVGSMEIRVPAGIAAKLEVKGSLNKVSVEGEWRETGNNYATSGSGKVLTISVDMSVGTLKLTTR